MPKKDEQIDFSIILSPYAPPRTPLVKTHMSRKNEIFEKSWFFFYFPKMFSGGPLALLGIVGGSGKLSWIRQKNTYITPWQWIPAFPEGYSLGNSAQRTSRDVLDLHLMQFEIFEGGFEHQIGCGLARTIEKRRFPREFDIVAFYGLLAGHRWLYNYGCFQALVNYPMGCRKFKNPILIVFV